MPIVPATDSSFGQTIEITAVVIPTNIQSAPKALKASIKIQGIRE